MTSKGVHGGWFEFGPFRLNQATNELLRDGQVVPFATRKAYETLLVLVRHRDRIVRKEELMEMVWPGLYVSEESLTQCISILRRALGDDAGHPQYIVTVPRQGYRFVAPVIEEAAAEASEGAAPPPEATEPPAKASESEPRFRWPASLRRLAWLTVVAVLLAALGLGYLTTGRERSLASPSAIRLTQAAPPGTSFVSGAVLSPDGKRLAFVASDESSGVTGLWVRALEEANARAIPGTQRAIRPFWSPDSRSIAFFSDGYLRRLDLPADPGGVLRPPETLAPTGFGSATGAWSTSGVILFAPDNAPVSIVSATGGTVRRVTSLNRAAGEVAHRFPQALPDGRRFLFSVIAANPSASATYVGSLDDGKRTKLLDGSIPTPFFVAPDQLLYVVDGVLMAQRFDAERVRLIGSPAAITAGAIQPTNSNGAVISATSELLAFWGPTDSTLVWFSREGSRGGRVDVPTQLTNPALSRDHRQLVAQGGPSRPGIWLVDLERGAFMNIVSDGRLGAWSPSGDQLAFGGTKSIRLRAVGRNHSGERVLPVPQETPLVQDWSRDGRYLLYSCLGVNGSRDLWVISLETGKEVPYLQGASTEGHARFSPDGRWVAYASDESNNWEVYLQSFPTPDTKRVISVGGGTEPQWREDGQELFYLARDGRVMAVRITPGPQPRFSPPQVLFRSGLGASGDILSRRNRYTVTSDGQRFLIETASAPLAPPVTFLVNWQSLITR